MRNADVSSRVAKIAGGAPIFRQCAALCYRRKRGLTEVLLITSRRSRRWILPKGWPIDGLSPAQTALQEAWEEAGVLGECGAQAIGQFHFFRNRGGNRPAMFLVDVFPLIVQATASNFPERKERDRQWFAPGKAAARVNSPELSALLRDLLPNTH